MSFTNGFKGSAFSRGFAVGYQLYPTTLAADTTLTAGTYLMQANCNCAGFKLTFNCASGNIVVKRNGDYYHTNQGAVDTTNSDATHKVYWTVANDGTIGNDVPNTGAAAVLGGSWGNGTAIGNYATTFNFWEIRWVDNKPFLNYGNFAAIKTLTNIILKNCALAGTTIFINAASGGTGASSIQRWQADNTNTFTANSMLMQLWCRHTLDYIYVQAANTAGASDYNRGLINLHLDYNSSLANGTASFLNISNSGGICVSAFMPVAATVFTLSNSKITFFAASGDNTKATIITKNCVFTSTGNVAYGLYAYRIAGGKTYNFRIYNCVFKGFTNAAIIATSSTYFYIEACRNTIFDSNAKIVSVAPTISAGIKNNGYYNNTSEANWTRGPYDETIAATSYSNYTSGTLHTDWVTYGPGDGWKCNTANITAGCDTNSFVGINPATQSHTGSAETATTQRLGLAPVFSSFT